MKKVYVSQPMRGKSEAQICLERSKAIERARKLLGEPVDIVPSYDPAFAEITPLECIGKSIELMAQADVAYFVPGWENARGCLIEHECAVMYGVQLIDDSRKYFSFGDALDLMKAGCRMTRDGWNGKGLSVVYQKGYPDGIPCNAHTAKAWGMKEGEPFRCEPYLQISTVDGSHAMWVPSIRDCLATDWRVSE